MRHLPTLRVGVRDNLGLSIALSLSLVFAVWEAPAFAQSPPSEIVLSIDHLRCLAENKAGYLASDVDPLIVFVGICPRLKPTRDETLAMASNSVPSINVRRSQDRRQPDAVIALRKAEFECLLEDFASNRLAASSPAAGKQSVVNWKIRTCK